jgi:hypothetical protein
MESATEGVKSMARRRPGRPKKSKRAVALVTRRVRRLIDLAHDGNIRQASKETGLPYPTLRDLYSGRRASPRLETIRALAKHYLVSVEWFTDERQPDPVPMGGVVGLLDPPSGTRGPDREVTIPFAAWEFWKVAEALDTYLESLPATPDRPIIGDATDDAANKRLTTFLLQPLLAAEVFGEPGAILREWAGREETEAWVMKLRALGRLWDVAIPSMLVVARSGVEVASGAERD